MSELQGYLDDRLKLARREGAIGAMHPSTRDDNLITFIAYSPGRHVVDGMQSRIVTLLAHPRRRTVALTMPAV